MTARTTRDAIESALTDVDFPAPKEQLLDAARRNNADADTVRALRAIPPVDYRNLDEVLASVRIRDEDPEEEAVLKAPRRRAHPKPKLAESAKDLSDMS
jgi:hypothetical protein